MGMIGEYARLTPAELERALGDPDWARGFVDEMLDAALEGEPDGEPDGDPASEQNGAPASEQNGDPASKQNGAPEGRPDAAGAAARRETGSPRCLDTDKAWHALAFLLRRNAFPVNIVYGEEDIPGADDWGYGPPRYLPPPRVRAAAEALRALPADRLIQGVEPADLTKADIYPNFVWGDAASLTYATSHYEALVPFFEAAVREGDAMLVWLD